jgi:hypothetical protein
MKSCRHWKLLAAALLAISTTEVTAQDQGRALAFHTGGESPNDPTYLLASKSVQKELALTDGQKTSFQKLRDAESSSHPFAGGALIGQSQEEIQKKLEQHATENRSRVFNLLTPQQIARLSEINIQVVGVTALGYDDVAEKLGLSAEQKAQLKTVSADARRLQDELNSANNGRPAEASKRQAYKEKLDQITADRKKQSLAILTDAQNAKFKQLQGAKFDTSTIQSNRKSFSSRGRIGGPPQVPRPNESTSN